MKKIKNKEKIGLHPVMFLLILCLIIIVLSGILSFFNVQATYSKVSSITGDYQVTTESVTSLFSLSGLKYIFTSTVSNFANFAVLSNLIIILLGIGIMVKSGFLKTIIILLTKKAKKTTVTFALVLICILSSIIGDLSYVIFIPLGALLFLYGKRNPMIGIITAFASLTCGNGISLFLTSVDSSLLTMTLSNAHIIDNAYSISPWAYIFVMFLLIIGLSLLLTNISENYIAKKVPKYEFPEDDLEDELVLTKRKMRGLIWAFTFGFVYLLIFIYNIIPGLPFSGNLLDYSQTYYIDKLFSYNSFFSNGFIFIVAVLFVIWGLCYGIGAKTITNNKEFIEALGYSLNGIGKIIVMIFAASIFINIFKYSNIGNVITAAFTNLVTHSNFSALPLILLLFVVVAISSLFLPNALNSWQIFSSAVPSLMSVGISPEFSQLVFRLGNSITIGLTPVFAYFIIYVAFLANYNQSKKSLTIGEAIKFQIPYVVISFLFFLSFIIVWYVIGLPLGVGASVAP